MLNNLFKELSRKIEDIPGNKKDKEDLVKLINQLYNECGKQEVLMGGGLMASGKRLKPKHDEIVSVIDKMPGKREERESLKKLFESFYEECVTETKKRQPLP